MADYKGHLVGASAFFALYLLALTYFLTIDFITTRFDTVHSFALPLVLLGVCLMFGLWPDVDTNSVAQDIFYAIFFIVDVALIVTGQFQEAAYLGLFAILPVLGKHRGWTHTFWAMILIPSPLFLLPYFLFPERPYAGLPYYGAAVIGYFSHLFMDGLVFRNVKKKRRR